MPKPPYDLSEAEIRRLCSHLLHDAEHEASRLKHNYIGTEHIFNGLTRIEGGVTVRMVTESGQNVKDVRNAIRREVGMGDDVVSEHLAFTPRAHKVLAQAVYLADDMGDELVTEEQLLLSLLQEGQGVAVRKLAELEIDIFYWTDYLTEQLQLDAPMVEGRFYDEQYLFYDGDEDEHTDSISLTAAEDDTMHIPTPLLDKYGRDLTEQARLGKIHEAVGRESEIRAVARTLTRSKKNNPLLVGDAGVGKTAVVEGLAWQIAEGTAPAPLRNKRVIQIELSGLVAGTSLRGQFEERIVGIIEEVENAPNIILFIDEIHTIVGAGDTIDSNLDAANILKPALARGQISCIGATTFEEYRRAVAKDPALDRRFRTIEIQEPSENDTLTILQNVYKRYEEHHSVKILPSACEVAVKLSVRYLPDRRLPDKALDLLDEACARLVIQSHSPDEQRTSSVVDPTLIAEVLSEWTGIPVTELNSDERKRFANMYEHITQKVMGQPYAVQVVTDAIKTHRAGLGNPRRPLGVFLFIGPSGVGKTALAQTLAEFLFGDTSALIRLDMSEFYDEHTASRLIGSPPGYKDNARGGQLTEALRRKPYTVVLLDEIEKAAPHLFDLFLQVFDEGRLTDAMGNSVDARHALWIMTSNIGTDEIGNKGVGFMGKSADALPDYKESLKRFFRPEFINRLDEVVVFHALDENALSKILDQQLGHLIERLDAQELSFQLSDAARQFLIDEGTSPSEGARPLARAIERYLMRPLSSALLEEKFGAGDTILVEVDENGAKLTFTPHAHTPTTTIDESFDDRY